jgi:hypothetical protein
MLRHWRIGAIVAAIMVGLVMVGLGLATASPSLAPRYWLWLVPVFGLLSVLTAWIGSPDRPRLGLRAVGRQLLHWLVIGGAVVLDFWLRGTGEEAGVAAGFDALLLLAVGCFLAGVHLAAIFALVGILLTATLFVLVKADQLLLDTLRRRAADPGRYRRDRMAGKTRSNDRFVIDRGR